MKKHLIIIYALLASVGATFAQSGGVDRATSTIRRPVFTGGGALRAGTSGTGTALTFGQSFAGNKKVGCRLVQIGVQTGIDADSMDFDANCNIIGYWSNGVFYGPVGIKEKKATNENFNIYPNPSNGLFYLTSVEMTSDFTIQVYSMNGELMLNENWIKGEIKQLNIENFAPSIYLVRCVTKNGKLIDKKLINKI